VDRAGFSLFALRDGTDDKWREYRFPFQVPRSFPAIFIFVQIL